MKILMCCAGVLVLGQGLATDYQKAGRLRIETTSSFSMETTSFSMEVDGQPVDNPRGGGGPSSKEKRSIVLVDEYLESKDGRPSRVRRTFDKLEAAGTTEFGERTMEIERETPLADVTIELTVGDDDVTVKAVEGSVSDDALLEGHLPDLALDALLPDKDVDVDDSWEIETEAIVRALGFDVEPVLFRRSEQPREEGGEGRRGGGGRGGFGRSMGGGTSQLFRTGTWEGKATLASLSEEHEGASCAEITLELACEGELPQPEGGGGRGRRFAAGPELAASNDFKIEAKGRLLYSIADKRPLLLEIEGKIRTDRHSEGSSERGSFSSSSTQEGTFEIQVQVTSIKGE